MTKSRIRRAAAPFVLLLLAFAVRLPHLGWGLPAVEEEAFPAKKAIEMWGFAAGHVHGDPQTAGWPALSFYAQLLLQHVQYGLGRLTGAYADRLDYWVAWLVDPTPVILWGRLLNALLTAGVAAVGASVGRRLAGTAGFWTVGLVLAGSPLLVRHGQMIDPDGWVGLLAALAVAAILAVGAGGRRRDYLLAGLWIGLGTAAKYTPLLLAPSFYLVHLERLRGEGRSLARLGLDDRRLLLAGLVCVLAFAAASPFTLVNLGVLRRDLAWQGDHMALGHFGHAGQGVGWVHYLVSVLPRALGWPAFAAGVAGLVAAARGRPVARALVWCALPLFLVLGALHTHFDRYMVPLLLPLAAGAAVLWSDRIAPRLGRRTLPAAAAYAALLAVPPVLATGTHLRVQGLPSTHVLAASWLLEHMDTAHEAVVSERYGPDLAPTTDELLQGTGTADLLSAEQRARLDRRPAVPYQVIPMYSVRPELAAWFYDLRLWEGYDWIVPSGGVKARYLAEPQRFPRERAFYADLERFTAPAAVFAPGPGARGPEIRIHRLTDEGRARLRSARPPLTLAEQRSWYDRAHRDHLLAAMEVAGRHAEAAGRWAVAVRCAEVMVDLAAAEQAPLARQRLAVTLFHAGRVEEAETLFRALAVLPTVDVTAWGYLGVIAEQKGDAAAARACYGEVIARDPAGDAGRLARRCLAALGSAGPAEPRDE